MPNRSTQAASPPGSPLLTAEAMQAADRFTIDEYGIPSFTLMESAGRGSADAMQAAYGPLGDEAVLVLCGKGNNGGDGLVVARRLAEAGVHVHVVLTAAPDALSEDAAHNLSLLRHLRDEGSSGHIGIEVFDTVDALTETANRLTPRLYVDALLGTGLTSALREPVDSVVEWVNERAVPTVAIDVPTGIHSDTGAVLGRAVQADRTVTMAAAKAGLYVGEGARHAGAVDVVDIGIPSFVLDRAVDRPGCARLTSDAVVQSAWPTRAPDAYKYSVGTAMVVGGSARFTGAPVLASTAAERSGAGYVTCACPDAAQSTVAGHLTSVPTLSLPTTDDGLAPAAVDRIADERADALLVGPGLGRTPTVRRFVHRLVETIDAPMVIDADGLNALADLEVDWTAHAGPNWILTPHEGEFRRLAGDVDLDDRIETVQAYARRWNVVLLLKGAPSVVAAPDGRTYVGRTATPALATAGTGDVLAGQCVGLLAQGLAPLDAAATALHLGGAAARRYADTRDPRTMTAPDLVEELPEALHDRFQFPADAS